MRQGGRFAALAAVLTAGTTVTAVGATPAGAADPGIGGKTITIGLITSLTGGAAPEYTGMAPSAQARVDYQNAHGGVNGRKIKLIVKDDATSPAGAQTAAQALIAQGVFGIIGETPVLFGAARVMQQAGVPVTGGAYDGPEWGQQPYTNMVSIGGSIDPHYPATTTVANFMKERGSKVVGSFGYAISPSSTAAASGFIAAATSVGLKKGYLNTSVPFGSIATAPIALALKSAGVDSVYMPMDDNTNFAIITAAKQAGVPLKVAMSATGYGQALLDDTSALADANGTYFGTVGRPVELKTPATKAFQSALAKYGHFSGVPGFDWYQGWSSADLMIKGLQLAGKNPTRTRFLQRLHKLTDYSAGGLLYPANLTLKRFGLAPAQTCGWFVQLQGSAFVPLPAGGKPTCGKTLPNSNQL